MTPIKHRDPWVHWTTDNFLTSEEHLKIYRFVGKCPRPSKPHRKVTMRLWDFRWYEETNKVSLEAEHVYNILERKSKQLARHFGLVEGEDYGCCDIMYVNCGSEFAYHRHTDALAKVLSNVLYFSFDGEGTRLFKTEDLDEEPSKIVEWQSNRLVSFYRTDNTWHDYVSTKKNRITFTLNFIKSKHQLDKVPEEKDIPRDFTLIDEFKS